MAFEKDMHLTDLPPEVILSVFSYLRPKFLLTTVAQVCKLFYNLISPEAAWKTRFLKYWPDRETNSTDPPYIASWKKLCIQHEEFDEYWLHPEIKFVSFNVRQEFPIDSVLLMNSGDTLIYGSRDRTISIRYVKNIHSVKCSSDLPLRTTTEHNGWVWTLTQDPIVRSRFLSGSWDNYIMLWDLHVPQRCARLSLGSPPLCMSWNEDILVAGCYDKIIRLIDPRTFTVVSSLTCHTRSVLCLYVNDTFIVSGSEDKTLCIFDRKAGKVYKNIQLPSPAFSLNKWDNGYNLMRVGGRNGEVHVFDTTANSLNLIKTVKLERHSQRITDMTEFKGALLTASADRTLQVHEPSFSSQTRCTLDERKAEITRLSTSGNTLASASSDGNISLWKVR